MQSEIAKYIFIWLIFHCCFQTIICVCMSEFRFRSHKEQKRCNQLFGISTKETHRGTLKENYKAHTFPMAQQFLCQLIWLKTIIFPLFDYMLCVYVCVCENVFVQNVAIAIEHKNDSIFRSKSV